MRLKTETTRADVTVEDATFHVRELTTTEQTEIALAERTSSALSIKKTFMKAVVDWVRVEDENGVALPCDETNKELVFESNPLLVEKILLQVPGRLQEAMEQEKKI